MRDSTWLQAVIRKAAAGLVPAWGHPAASQVGLTHAMPKCGAGLVAVRALGQECGPQGKDNLWWDCL